MSVSSNASSASNKDSVDSPSSTANTDSSELTHILNRRQEIMESQEAGIEVRRTYKVVNVYTDFPEFSRNQIKDYQKTFNTYDLARDGFLDLQELKFMMEKLGAPQTHLGLKQMIAEVDEDNDGKISFREFLLIFRKAQAGELDSDSGLNQLARLTEVDVDQVGVSGAKNFFEAKIEQQLRTNKFHDEIRAEQEERRREEEERAQRRQQFQQRAAIFQ
ncbi:LOW QUALITY PROTEIN: EF-hand domain-containing protein D2 homolog [Drosophila eugracilis]|uniref:LOW QUALITY PROTEIN: EF-hand domain-containing protein D2 homolog n=1 Tax=Drosophila eugracilis TaxID=29029 RepID=UPI0007E771AA|nr:LOW QUALITY PROTEIN: EF-hand domain-containing protein D2 homolog [Drosophila eugracilis]